MSRKVSYYYHEDIGNYHYGNMHPMKPHWMRMTDSLIKSYGMDQKLDWMVSFPHSQNIESGYLDEFDLTKFHSDDYIDFLKNVTPENIATYSDQLSRCK